MGRYAERSMLDDAPCGLHDIIGGCSRLLELLVCCVRKVRAFLRVLLAHGVLRLLEWWPVWPVDDPANVVRRRPSVGGSARLWHYIRPVLASDEVRVPDGTAVAEIAAVKAGVVVHVG